MIIVILDISSDDTVNPSFRFDLLDDARDAIDLFITNGYTVKVSMECEEKAQ